MLIFMHMEIFLGTGNSNDSGNFVGLEMSGSNSDGVNSGCVSRSSSGAGSTKVGRHVLSLMESQCN